MMIVCPQFPFGLPQRRSHIWGRIVCEWITSAPRGILHKYHSFRGPGFLAESLFEIPEQHGWSVELRRRAEDPHPGTANFPRLLSTLVRPRHPRHPNVLDDDSDVSSDSDSESWYSDEQEGREDGFLLHWRVRVSHCPSGYSNLVEGGRRLKRSVRSWCREHISKESMFSCKLGGRRKRTVNGYEEFSREGWYAGITYE